MKNLVKFKDLSLKQKCDVVNQSWHKLTNEQKEEYNKCATNDQKRYEKELKQIEKKGYFINNEGKDSRDLFKVSKSGTKDVKMKEAQKKKVLSKKEEPKKSEPKDDNICRPKRPFTSFMFFSIENGA